MLDIALEQKKIIASEVKESLQDTHSRSLQTRQPSRRPDRNLNIPRYPPFKVHLSNLPYQLSADDVGDFFYNQGCGVSFGY